MKFYWSILLTFLFQLSSSGQVLAVLKYDGGGDWYANPTALKNLCEYYNNQTDSKTYVLEKEVTCEDLLKSGTSFLHATGHGRMVFSDKQREQLRIFALRGGFIHFDDNYGMKEFAEAELRLIFPEAEVSDVSQKHPIFSVPNKFPEGLPKIHEHDAKAPRAQGYFVNGELVAILTSETDLGDGWEDQEVHNDPQVKREQALKMGSNLVHWALLRSVEP